MLYHTLVQPYCEYCNIVWPAGHSTSLESLFRKQKKAIRLINYTNYNAHTSLIFCKLKHFSDNDINKFQTCCFVYKSLNGLWPNIFNGVFVTNSDMHDHDTRHGIKLHAISHRIKVCELSIQIYDTKNGILWRSLSSNHPHHVSLKRDVKHQFFSIQVLLFDTSLSNTLFNSFTTYCMDNCSFVRYLPSHFTTVKLTLFHL